MGHLVAVTAGASALALMLGACSPAASQGPGEAGNGEGVAFGATTKEWQAAFEEVDGEWDLVWETASAAASDSGVLTRKVADAMEERSGGKVTIEVAFQQAISGAPQEGDEALGDGRTDMHLLVPFQQPSDFPVSGTLLPESTILRGGGFISGYLASIGATNEVAFGLQELHDEFDQHGLTISAPMPTQPQTSMACREPVTSLADLKGKQIRVGPAATYGQIEALGATPVSVVWADLYESLQRGIIDCMVVGTSTMAIIPGMTELAPYIITPVGTSFASTPGIDLIGSNSEDWPLLVKQLVYDGMNEYTLTNTREVLNQLADQYAAVQEAGGEFLDFDSDVNKALAKHNTSVADGWRTSKLLAEPDAYVDALEKSYEKWEKLLIEAGFPTEAFSEYEKFKDADLDWDKFDELFADNVLIPNRPGA